MKAKKSPKNTKMLIIGASVLTVASFGLFLATRPKVKKPIITSKSSRNEDAKSLQEITPTTDKVNTQQPKTLGELIQKTSATKDDNRLLVIGDSQVKRNLYECIMQDWGNRLGLSVSTWNKEGTTPAKILDLMGNNTPEGAELKNALKQKPPIIFIQLGDNGINGPTEVKALLSKIVSNYKGVGNPLIIWSGPFPLCLPIPGQDTKYVKAPPCSTWRCLPNFQNEKRVVITNKIKDGIAQANLEDVIFISPYETKAFENYETRTCFTVDGIHLTRAIAQDYVTTLLDMDLVNAK